MQFRRTVTKQINFFPQHAVFQNTNLNTETLHPRTKAFCGWGGGGQEVSEGLTMVFCARLEEFRRI